MGIFVFHANTDIGSIPTAGVLPAHYTNTLVQYGGYQYATPGMGLYISYRQTDLVIIKARVLCVWL